MTTLLKYYSLFYRDITDTFEFVLFYTCVRLFSKAGKTSPTVLSTRTPPIILKHFLVGSTPFKASITTLNKHHIVRKIQKYNVGIDIEQKGIFLFLFYEILNYVQSIQCHFITRNSLDIYITYSFLSRVGRVTTHLFS